MTNSCEAPLILWSDRGETAEQDCACSVEGIALKIPAVTDSNETDCACPDQDCVHPSDQSRFDPSLAWQQTAGVYRAPLKDSYELAFSPLGQAGVVVLNKSARQVLDTFQVPRTAAEVAAMNPVLAWADIEQATRQLAALGLLHSPSIATPTCQAEPRTLTAWLHVTNACNLCCAYCYVAKTNSAMNETVGRAAIESVVRSAIKHQFEAIKLKYAGGEATLNFPLVMVLHDYAKTLAAKHHLHLHEVVLSNGVGLTTAMIDFMRTEHIRLMISLDGIGAAHDAQRVFENGAGSFRAVSHSIDRAVARGLPPHLSITVTARTADAVAEAVAFALDRDLLFNLNFFRETECAVAWSDLRASEAQLVAGLRRALAVIEKRLPRRSLIAAIVDRAAFTAPHDRACGAGHSYLVIDQHGGLARCQMEIEKTVANVFTEDPLQSVRDIHDGFQNVPVDRKEGCRDCEWRYWCAGGCSLLTFKLTGRSDVKSPNCNIYRSIYPDVLRLEGLRLLKWTEDVKH